MNLLINQNIKETALLGPVIIQNINNFPNDEHGTFCADVMTARSNNDIGGCGIANLTKLNPIACMVNNTGSQSSLARAEHMLLILLWRYKNQTLNMVQN